MRYSAETLSLEEWDPHYASLARAGMREPAYGGPLSRHAEDGDRRLLRLRFDNAPASLDLWNFLLSEEDRLRDARLSGHKIVGTMKDLGTVPVMAYALPKVTAFYPDGAWWIPCIMELGGGLLSIADSLGINESFCPVRAMLGAFVTGEHFPVPDLLVCSVGAVCDDFSAIAQRLNGMGHPVFWWNIPRRRRPDPGESRTALPGGRAAATEQVHFVKGELRRAGEAMEELTGEALTETRLRNGIAMANRVRRTLDALRLTCFTAKRAPLPALELLIAEMLAIHFCSDREETLRVLQNLLKEAKIRSSSGDGYGGEDCARIFWVNPVADLRIMHYLEDSGGRVCGTDYMFTHTLDLIPDDIDPMEALARTALADSMIGPASDRAERICLDVERYHAEALLVSRIPGASHCALETDVICDRVRTSLGLPTAQIEVSPVSDAQAPTIRTRIEALVESVRKRRARC